MLRTCVDGNYTVGDHTAAHRHWHLQCPGNGAPMVQVGLIMDTSCIWNGSAPSVDIQMSTE